MNTVGSYDCMCIAGFEGSGFAGNCSSEFKPLCSLYSNNTTPDVTQELVNSNLVGALYSHFAAMIARCKAVS